ncbi:hypothetical protein EXIGLDRAFT_754011 [Exidia glandulosa HHB12029]|uniref:RRM domain-containing protein n=1 Tax=Exidia glandulosa HHB12029 TaxID=1314781 RepID=A0A165ZMX0_EXIGL|nr:hypothetical protein EXIGLDRAFT_754011 [Exidia glandulosa HHB12029]
MSDATMNDVRGPNKRLRKPYERPDQDRAPEGQWLHDRAPRTSGGGGGGGGGSSDRGARPARIRDTGSDTEVSPKLIVSNLHYEVGERDLTTAFGAYGSFARDPFIRYDRSGRSTGVGVVIYSTADEAAHAKVQMQGVILKGEHIDIKYEKFTDRPRKGPDGGKSSSDPSSLLNRIGKPPLKDRITNPDDAPMDTDSSGPGPVRSKSFRGGRGSSDRGRGGGRPPRGEKKAPKTAEDLDKELEKYADTAAKPASGDVEMAT